jgi:hypothetical protein
VTGMVQGGWEFVAAAYTVSAVVLAAYGAWVVLRYRTEKSRAAAQAGRETRV